MEMHPFRKWRLANGVTLAAVESALGYDNSHLSRVERGIVTPSVDLIVALAGMTNGEVTKEQIFAFATKEAA